MQSRQLALPGLGSVPGLAREVESGAGVPDPGLRASESPPVTDGETEAKRALQASPAGSPGIFGVFLYVCPS